MTIITNLNRVKHFQFFLKSFIVFPSMSTSEEGANVHPYAIKLDLNMEQLDRLVNKMYENADCKMILTNVTTGDATYDINLRFADKLDSISTIVSGLGKRIAEKATSIRDTVASLLEKKDNSGEIQFIGEIEPSKKRIKTELLSSDDEDENAPPTDKRDGHFRYAKTNENDAAIHSFHCNECDGVFRDRNELRNHIGQHAKEFYKCLVCEKIFRTVNSFENHKISHSASHTCSICGQFFKLKSSLTNHNQVHLNLKLPCTHQNCDKTFKQRSNQLLHIKWGHNNTRDVKCTHCEKYYFTPNNMRSHRHYKHGIIADITPGHPEYGLRVPVPEIRRKERERRKQQKKLNESIPSQISGPLCSPPPQLTDDDNNQPKPGTSTSTPRKERNRSRSRNPSTPAGRPQVPPRPPQTRQQTRSQLSAPEPLKTNIDELNDDELPEINF